MLHVIIKDCISELCRMFYLVLRTPGGDVIRGHTFCSCVLSYSCYHLIGQVVRGICISNPSPRFVK